MLKKKLFCSWSGGKNSCLSLYKISKTSHVVCLVSAMIGSDDVAHSHGLSHSMLRAQADSLNIPLLIFNSLWEDYEKNYNDIIVHLKNKYGLELGVFGNIENDVHKNLYSNICESNNMSATFPLWQKEREAILLEFISLGFKAKIIAVNEKKLHRDCLGKDLNPDLIREFKEKKVDIWGENGEYHTIVYDGPLFSYPLGLRLGDISLKSGYWTQEVNI